MLGPTNLWMAFAGLVILFAGIFVRRKEIAAARGWDKLILLGGVFFAASLAIFAPEHFRGPQFIQMVVPRWMPWHAFWPNFIGCALLAAAASLALRKFARLSSTLLGVMFFLFVCMIYMPSALKHLHNRFVWTYVLRDLSFSAGAWALAGVYWRASAPRASKCMILFARLVIAVAGIFFGVMHFLHPANVPGVPLETMMPSWVPFPSVWGYIAGAILLVAGIGLALNLKSRMAAASIGALATFLTVCLYLVILILAYRSGSAAEINEGLNYVGDTLLFAGAALALAWALPGDVDDGERA